MTKYRNVDTSTLAGLKEAERLKAAGWEIVRSGLFFIQLRYRKNERKEQA